MDNTITMARKTKLKTPAEALRGPTIDWMNLSLPTRPTTGDSTRRLFNMLPEYHLAANQPTVIHPYILPYTNPQAGPPFTKQPLPRYVDAQKLLDALSVKLQKMREDVMALGVAKDDESVPGLKEIAGDEKVYEAFVRVMREVQLRMTLIAQVAKITGDLQETFRGGLARLLKDGVAIEGYKDVVSHEDIPSLHSEWEMGETLRTLCEKVFLRIRKTSTSATPPLLDSPPVESPVHEAKYRVPIYAIQRRTDVMVSVPSKHALAECMRAYIRGTMLVNDLNFALSTALRAAYTVMHEMRPMGSVLMLIFSLEKEGVDVGWPEGGKEIWETLDAFMMGYSAWFQKLDFDKRLDKLAGWRNVHP